jgi:hypothetical protein
MSRHLRLAAIIAAILFYFALSFDAHIADARGAGRSTSGKHTNTGAASKTTTGTVNVKGYYRKDGTYVRPHVRTPPDGNPYNNYSFPGNYNPNTGRITGGDPAAYLNRNRTGTTSGYSTMIPAYAPSETASPLGNPASSSSASAPQQVAMLPSTAPGLSIVPPNQEITKTYASLVQYDGPKIKSGITLDAQFIDDGSGNGEAVVSDMRNYMLKGTFSTIKPGSRDWPKPKILDRQTLNKLQILSDRPWVIGSVTNSETVLECVYGATRPLEQKMGACRDNFGNRYHLVLTR